MDQKIISVVIMEQDYDYADVIGVFATIERAIQYCREKKLDINRYDVMLYTSEDKSTYYENRHCKVCNVIITDGKDKNLNYLKVDWEGWHCPLHYINAKRSSDIRMAESERRTREYQIKLEKEKQEKIDFRHENNIPEWETISRTPDGKLVRGVYLGEGIEPKLGDRPLLEHMISGSVAPDGTITSKEFWKYAD